MDLAWGEIALKPDPHARIINVSPSHTRPFDRDQFIAPVLVVLFFMYVKYSSV